MFCLSQENGNGSASNGSDDALDYSRCYNGQSKSSSQSEVGQNSVQEVA